MSKSALAAKPWVETLTENTTQQAGPPREARLRFLMVGRKLLPSATLPVGQDFLALLPAGSILSGKVEHPRSLYALQRQPVFPPRSPGA